MSPIPSVATAFALSTPAPSVMLDPDSAGQGASMMSQHLRTGGVLVAVVALVSVASYFYHGRGTVNHTRTSNTWVSLTGLLSSIRHRGSPTTSTAVATDWPVDVEVGFEHHVSMVYARFFHPAFWNLVECHPGTPSTPTIYVEDEGNENPVPDLNPPGVNSFLDMDDDDDSDGNDDGKRVREKPDRVGRHGVKEVPPYDTSSPTSVSFSSEIIGTTVRQGAFLSVLDELEDDSSETSPSDSELDFPGSPYDGILTTDSEPDFACSPYDGISTVDSESDFSCSPYDGIVVTPPRSSSGACARRHGVVDMTYFAQSLKDTISEEGYPLVPTIPHRAGLLDLSSFVEMDLTLPCGSLQGLDPADEESTIANYDNGVHDTHEALVDGSNDVNIPGAPHLGGDLMRKLLLELRDPELDCTPRSLSEDSDSEYSNDDDEEGASVPYPAPPWFLRNARRSSVESTFTPGTNSEVSDEGSIYPMTPPSKPATSLASSPNDHEHLMPSPVMGRFNEEVMGQPFAVVWSAGDLTSPLRFHFVIKPLSFHPPTIVIRLPILHPRQSCRFQLSSFLCTAPVFLFVRFGFGFLGFSWSDPKRSPDFGLGCLGIASWGLIPNDRPNYVLGCLAICICFVLGLVARLCFWSRYCLGQKIHDEAIGRHVWIQHSFDDICAPVQTDDTPN
ncbi:hypothetical protein JVT61DRAFT_3367 [Boletus reticuloceps]|uniref:Transmembrane protein n=1 Tax=Boletus reticuloceps TaxID=495285 RepID=A0A8I2YN69_9AGAM|nr:hypothetical protein JVT61DRAFT_3367 [Boletus reticuloceps]